jgi:hypothetical protein
MSQATTHASQEAAMDDRAYQQVLDRLESEPAMAVENITLAPEAGRGLGLILLGLGIVGLAVVVVASFLVGFRPAFAAYEIGVFSATAMSLGALFFTLCFHITNAGWCATIRRQFENAGALLPLCMVMVGVIIAIEIATGGTLLTWLAIDPETDHLLHHKRGYLNVAFLIIRFLFYAGVWSYLSLRMRAWSVEQDRTGDRWLTRRMRFNSGWGLLIFALTTAFFAFDFLMGMDFRFYSTMWGVYYYAACAYGSLALMSIVFAWLIGQGKLTGVVTGEHTHDLGKLMFAFVVFWAYIAFGQYFLIWYGNVPEETMYFIFRRQGVWMGLGKALIVAHFLIPFFLLISRVPKQNPRLLAAIGVFMIFAHVIDMTYIVQPMVDANQERAYGLSTWWLIVCGLLGVFGVYGFFLVRLIVSAPLVPTKDPRLPLALEHRNYV